MIKPIAHGIFMLLLAVCLMAAPVMGEMDDPNKTPAAGDTASTKSGLPEAPAQMPAPPAGMMPGMIPGMMPGMMGEMGPGMMPGMMMPPGVTPPNPEMASPDNNYGGGGRFVPRRKTAPQTSTKAGVIVKIQCTKDILDVSDQLLKQLLGSWVRPGASISVSPIMPYGPHEECLLYSINLWGPAEKNATPEDKEELCRLMGRFEETLRKEYLDAQNQYLSRLKVVRDQLNAAESAFSGLRERGRELREQAGMTDLNRQHVLDMFNHMEERQNVLQMELAGLEAQRREMQNQVKMMRDNLETNLADDPISQQLREIIAMKRQAFELAQKYYEKSGDAAPLGYVWEPQQELKEAEIRLAEHQETRKAASGSNELQKVNMKLGEIAVQVAQKQEELKFINLKLDDMRHKDLLRLAENYSIEVEMKVDQAQREYQEAAALAAQLQRELAMLTPPRVVVLGD